MLSSLIKKTLKDAAGKEKTDRHTGLILRPADALIVIITVWFHPYFWNLTQEYSLKTGTHIRKQKWLVNKKKLTPLNNSIDAFWTDRYPKSRGKLKFSLSLSFSLPLFCLFNFSLFNHHLLVGWLKVKK